MNAKKKPMGSKRRRTGFRHSLLNDILQSNPTINIHESSAIEDPTENDWVEDYYQSQYGVVTFHSTNDGPIWRMIWREDAGERIDSGPAETVGEHLVMRHLPPQIKPLTLLRGHGLYDDTSNLSYSDQITWKDDDDVLSQGNFVELRKRGTWLPDSLVNAENTLAASSEEEDEYITLNLGGTQLRATSNVHGATPATDDLYHIEWKGDKLNIQVITEKQFCTPLPILLTLKYAIPNQTLTFEDRYRSHTLNAKLSLKKTESAFGINLHTYESVITSLRPVQAFRLDNEHGLHIPIRVGIHLSTLNPTTVTSQPTISFAAPNTDYLIADFVHQSAYFRNGRELDLSKSLGNLPGVDGSQVISAPQYVLRFKHIQPKDHVEDAFLRIKGCHWKAIDKLIDKYKSDKPLQNFSKHFKVEGKSDVKKPPAKGKRQNPKLNDEEEESVIAMLHSVLDAKIKHLLSSMHENGTRLQMAWKDIEDLATPYFNKLKEYAEELQKFKPFTQMDTDDKRAHCNAVIEVFHKSFKTFDSLTDAELVKFVYKSAKHLIQCRRPRSIANQRFQNKKDQIKLRCRRGLKFFQTKICKGMTRKSLSKSGIKDALQNLSVSMTVQDAFETLEKTSRKVEQAQAIRNGAVEEALLALCTESWLVSLVDKMFDNRYSYDPNLTWHEYFLLVLGNARQEIASISPKAERAFRPSEARSFEDFLTESCNRLFDKDVFHSIDETNDLGEPLEEYTPTVESAVHKQTEVAESHDKATALVEEIAESCQRDGEKSAFESWAYQDPDRLPDSSDHPMIQRTRQSFGNASSAKTKLTRKQIAQEPRGSNHDQAKEEGKANEIRKKRKSINGPRGKKK